MVVKNILLIVLVLALFIVSCNDKETIKQPDLKVLYKLSIYDTLDLEVLTPSIRILERTNKRILLADLMGNKVYQTDLSGKLLNQFQLTSNEPEKIGAYTYGLTYLGDTSIAAIGTKGLFLYDLEGKLLNKYLKTVNKIRGGSLARRLRLRDIWIDEKPCILGIWLSSLSEEERALSNSDINIYRKIKFLTIFDLLHQSYYVDLPFEDNSIFFKDDKQYDDAVCFDYNKSNKKIYSIISPDKYVNIYQVTYKNIILEKSVPLEAKDFELRKILPFGNPYNQMQLYVNSEFRTLDISEDGKHCLISYRTGIPIEEYQKAKSNAEIPKIHRMFNKRYVILLENDEQKSAPILLPKGVKEVVYFKSPEYILLSTDDFESSEKTSFYVARLEKIR